MQLVLQAQLGLLNIFFQQGILIAQKTWAFLPSGMMIRMRTSGNLFRKRQSKLSDETCSPCLVPLAPSPGGGLAEPRAGQDVRHAPPRDPRSRGDLRGEAEGAVDL